MSSECNGILLLKSSPKPKRKQGQELRRMASANNDNSSEKRKKEAMLDLDKYLDKDIRVKFIGGRECSGTLKGYDPLMNLVLDNVTEYLRDPDDPYKLTEDTRPLGLVVCRGTGVVLVCPQDGMESISNPFIPQE